MDYQTILDRVKEKSLHAQPGILLSGKTMESFLGHTVVNLSGLTLKKPQVSALEKGLTFCPTPGPPAKSQIWLDLKEFYRKLTLKYHFYTDNKLMSHLDEMDQ